MSGRESNLRRPGFSLAGAEEDLLPQTNTDRAGVLFVSSRLPLDNEAWRRMIVINHYALIPKASLEAGTVARLKALNETD